MDALPPPAHIEEKAERVRNFAVRVFLASILEVGVYILLCGLFVLRANYTSPFPNLIVVITEPGVLIAASAVVISIFYMILTGSTPIVALMQRGSLQSFLNPLRGLSDLLDHAASATSTVAEVLSASRRREASPEGDKVEDTFLTYIARSREAVAAARGRPNALLFFGTIVALLGLIFFVLTLPGSRYGLFLPGDPTPTSQDAWATGIQLLPRLLMLVFIQVLAGFFLRQYRSSMEDFRYYESILRHREAQYLSYTLRKQSGDQAALLKFAEEIMKEPTHGLLTAGQTTSSLEAQRLAENDFATLYDKLAELLASAKPKPKPKPKPRRKKAGTNSSSD
jgi:hypothetical protein